MMLGARISAWALAGIFVDAGTDIFTVTYAGPGVGLVTCPTRIPRIFTWLPTNSPGAVENLAVIVIDDPPPLVSAKARPKTTTATAAIAIASLTRGESCLTAGTRSGGCG